MDIIWYMYMYLGELLQGVMVDGSFEYYFNGGKLLCVYMYNGDYFYWWLFQGVWTLFDYIEYTHLEYFSGVLFLSFFLYILPDPLVSIIGRCTLYTRVAGWKPTSNLHSGSRMKAYK